MTQHPSWHRRTLLTILRLQEGHVSSMRLSPGGGSPEKSAHIEIGRTLASTYMTNVGGQSSPGFIVYLAGLIDLLKPFAHVF